MIPWRIFLPGIEFAVLLLVVFDAFERVQEGGQIVTSDNALWRDRLTFALWTCLVVSVLFSVWGVAGSGRSCFLLSCCQASFPTSPFFELVSLRCY
jgi:hypothetical protein